MASPAATPSDNGLQTPDTGGNPAAKRLPRHAARQVGVLYWRHGKGVLSVMFGQDDSSGGVSFPRSPATG